MKNAPITFLTLIALTTLPTVPAAMAAGYDFETVLVPGSYPMAFDLNNRGKIVGWFTDDVSGAIRGFVLDGDDFTAVDVPGADSTYPRGINDSGVIAGQYRLGTERRGFVFDGEEFLAVGFPGAPASSWAQDVNERGDVVGVWCEDPVPPCDYDLATEVLHGFVWSRNGASSIDYPNAVSTVALGIDDRGRVSGYYWDGDLREHGFVLEKGEYRTLDVPGAVFTESRRINNRGEVVTLFLHPDGWLGSVVEEKDGSFVPLEFPGAAMTLALGQNERGDVVGVYLAVDGRYSFVGRRLGKR